MVNFSQGTEFPKITIDKISLGKPNLTFGVLGFSTFCDLVNNLEEIPIHIKSANPGQGKDSMQSQGMISHAESSIFYTSP
jgi:hypothetical protein